MQNYKAQGIILKRINLGEADRIITVFTKELGKVKFVAKGVRRLKSKSSGSLEPFYFVELVLVRGKSLDILTSVNILDIPIKDNPDIETIKLASFFAELIDKTIPEESHNIEIYELLEEIFANITYENKEMLRFYFEAKLFQLSGLSPELSICVRCGKKPQNEAYFSVNSGGILDSNCGQRTGDAMKIDKNIAKAWNFAICNDFNNFCRLKLEQKTQNDLLNISKKYLKHITQREFKSDTI